MTIKKEAKMTKEQLKKKLEIEKEHNELLRSALKELQGAIWEHLSENQKLREVQLLKNLGL